MWETERLKPYIEWDDGITWRRIGSYLYRNLSREQKQGMTTKDGLC